MHRERIYRRPGSLLYWADVPGEGPVCLETANLFLARQRAERRHGARDPDPPSAADVAPLASPPVPTVTFALAEHLQRSAPDLAAMTRQIYLEKAGQLRRLLGDVPLSELTRGHIDEYAAARRGEGVSDETIRKELVLLRASLRTLRDLCLLPIPLEPLFPKLRSRYVPRQRWLEPSEYAALVGKLSPSRQLYVQVACYTGARRGELERMQAEDIDWGRGMIRLRGTKNEKAARFVPLHAELLAALAPFRGKAGRLLRPWENVCRDLALACAKAKIPPVTPNDLRRTFASWLVQQGAPTFTVTKLMGHATEKMIHLTYGHLNAPALVAAIDLLPSWKN